MGFFRFFFLRGSTSILLHFSFFFPRSSSLLLAFFTLALLACEHALSLSLSLAVALSPCSSSPRPPPSKAASPSSSFRRKKKLIHQNHAPAGAPLQAPVLRHPAAVAGHRGEKLSVAVRMGSIPAPRERRKKRQRKKSQSRMMAAVVRRSSSSFESSLSPRLDLLVFFSMRAQKRLVRHSISKNLERRECFRAQNRRRPIESRASKTTGKKTHPSKISTSTSLIQNTRRTSRSSSRTPSAAEGGPLPPGPARRPTEAPRSPLVVPEGARPEGGRKGKMYQKRTCFFTLFLFLFFLFRTPRHLLRFSPEFFL